MFLSLLAFLSLAIVGTAIVWLGSNRLEAASERIADFYNLPEIVKGAIITAIASSFPELSSVILATLVHGRFELGVAAIVGSAIFNILVIPSCSVIFGQTLQANRSIVYKEALFYIIAVSVLLLMMSFAVIYFPVKSEDKILGTVTRGLAFIPVALYCVYLFMQYADTRDHQRRNSRRTSVKIWKEWGMLLACIIVVAVGVELLIRATLKIGELLDAPPFLLGLTLIAAGTSLPDMFISIRAAQRGFTLSSLSNVLGSNTFDLLIAVPIGVLIAGPTVIDFGQAAPMMGSLTAATIAMFVLMRLNMKLNLFDAVSLLALYALFVVWIILETLGITSLVNT